MKQIKTVTAALVVASVCCCLTSGLHAAPQAKDVTFSNSAMSLTFARDGSVSLKRQDTGQLVSKPDSMGWSIYNWTDATRWKEGTRVALDHMVQVGPNELLFSSSDGQYQVKVAVAAKEHYFTFELLHVSNNPETGKLDDTWPGHRVEFDLQINEQEDGWQLNTIPLNPMVEFRNRLMYTEGNLSTFYWPYPQYAQTGDRPQPQGAVAVFPSRSDTEHDRVLIDVWVGEPSLPRPNRENMTSWTHADVAAWLRRWVKELPPLRMITANPGDLKELYELADDMQAHNINAIYLFDGKWQYGCGIASPNPGFFPNGMEEFKAVAAYCAERGIKLYLHQLSAVVRKNNMFYSANSPNGMHPDLAKSASGTLLTDMPLNPATIEVRPDPGSKPFVAPPSWHTSGGMGLVFPPNYMKQYSSIISIDSDLFTYKMIETTSELWRIEITGRLGGKGGGNRKWNAAHKAGDRVDFVVKPANHFVPDSRSDLLRQQAEDYANLLNNLQVPYGAYDGSAYHEDLGSWGLRRFSQMVYERVDHPTHAISALGIAPFGHFEYNFKFVREREGGFGLQYLNWGLSAPVRGASPSWRASELDEINFALGYNLGVSLNNGLNGPHVGLQLKTARNHGQWEAFLAALKMWTDMGPHLTDEQKSIIKKWSPDFYVPSEGDTQWVITRTRAMLRPGVDEHWQEMVERGPISPRQHIRADGEILSPLHNPFVAQTPAVELHVLPAMASDHPANQSLMPPETTTFNLSNTTDSHSWSYASLGQENTLNMSRARGVAMSINGDNSGAVLVLNIGKRDYAVTIDFAGERTVEIPNGEVVWNRSNRRFGYKNSRTYGDFNYGSVSNFRLFLGRRADSTRIQISNIQAMEEDRNIGLVHPVLTLNGDRVTVDGTIPCNHYLVYQDGPTAEIYDPNWNHLFNLPVSGGNLSAVNGDNTFSVTSTRSPDTWLSTRIKVRDADNRIAIQK